MRHSGGSEVLAVIGCGAIAEQLYLPALRGLRRRPRLVMVDRDEARLDRLGRLAGAWKTFTDYRQALPHLTAAVISTPPELHFEMADRVLEAGGHVLCEKPLTLRAAEARTLVEKADSRGLVLAVNNTRRLFAAAAHVRDALAAEELGPLRSIRYYEGQPFEWPTASGFYFRAGDEPRGVLLDRGAHVLDLICWWLAARPELVRSENDSFGGPEAVAHVRLRHEKCEIDLRFSWLYRQENRFFIEGRDGSLEGDIYEWRRIEHRPQNGRKRILRLAAKEKVFDDFGPRVLGSFLEACRGEAEPLVTGAGVLDSLELIDRCYAERIPFELPWYESLGRAVTRETRHG
ncbi:MAG: Gfo/Idh/MocA family oxidoreductase [Holophagales bacterium]|nr:Gfo/Idh/MocA family oxidoreductase [Holophagales bacterium]